MAASDYLLCSHCERKTIYDAEVDYAVPNLAQIAAICTSCAEQGYKLITYDPTPKTVRIVKTQENPMAGQAETEQLEREMIDAITAYLRTADPAVTRLRAVRIMAVTDNGDTPSGERVLYANGESATAMITAAAPVSIIGASDPPSVPGYGAIPFTG